MKILITGDLAVTQPYDASSLIDKSVVDLFVSSDINIVNLEAPVTESASKILKTGPNLKSHRQSVIDVFKALNVKVATLANNHLMDYDEQGVADTLAFCKEQGVETVGGGMNLKEASRTLYIDTPEGKIAIVNFAENEWIAATPTSAGFNPMDIIDNARQIQDARTNADYVFVIIHGGHEYYSLPSPRMVKQYRYYAEQGADTVVGHHTHCIGGNEVYKGVPIYYSLGNFLFTKHSKNDDWYTGLVLEIEVKSGQIDSKLHPLVQTRQTFNLTLKSHKDKEEIFSLIDDYTKIIGDEKRLLEEWEKYAANRKLAYLNYWSPLSFIGNRYIRAVFRKMKLNFSSKKARALFLNLMRCEAYKDLSIEVIKKHLNK